MIADDDRYTVDTMPLAQVKRMQVMWLPWMKAQAEAIGATDDTVVTVVRKCTPFGNYLLAIEPAN